MDSLEAVIVIGLAASATCGIGALYVGGTLHRWAAWRRVRRQQRELRAMRKYQNIGNGARRRK